MSNITQFTTGGVKSVQYGIGTGGAATNVVTTISTINPAKSVVILSPGGYGFITTSYQTTPTCYLVALTSTSFTTFGPYYYNAGYSGLAFSWQVIEYY